MISVHIKCITINYKPDVIGIEAQTLRTRCRGQRLDVTK